MNFQAQRSVLSPSKPLFWGIFGLTSLLGIIFCIYFFPQAVPLVSLNITMSRTEALHEAAHISSALTLGPSIYQQAASFETDATTKLYLEREGGMPAFETMLHEHYYEPYTWHVRHFQEGVHHEATFYFTPTGKPYGFYEHIPETIPGPQLSTQEAQNIAETTAQSIWLAPMKDYKLIEHSQEVRLSKRTDHIFIYEHATHTFGKGSYRLRLTVSGDKLSRLTYFFKVPEDFLLNYQELRSSNKGIATAATIIYFLVYLLGCAGIGLMVLSRQQYLLWKPACLLAVIVGMLSFLAQLNQFPLHWMYYDTALSTNQFFWSLIMQSFFGWISTTALLLCVIVAAEGLTRKAFAHQPQLWTMWSRNTGSSYEIIGRTIGGYLLVGLDLGLITAIYFITTRFFGWWVPSDHLVHPNILATYVPWLSAVVPSLQAGILEECAFRALPLATAALLGTRYGKRTWWIAGAFIIQVLVFGAAHANYTTQPAYARLLELIIPSCIFGYAYLRYGLLPAILSHVLFDLVWFSLPIFVAHAADTWLQRSIIITLALIPLIIVLIQRILLGRLHTLALEYYNGAWQTKAPIAHPETVIVIPEVTQLSVLKKCTLVLLACATGIWLIITIVHQTSDIPSLTLSRDQAQAKAQEYLEQQHIKLPNNYTSLGLVRTDINLMNKLAHQFVWLHGGKEVYHRLIDSYLMPPYWNIRFLTFEGSILERAQEYQILLTDHGTVRRVAHTIPEALPGSQLTEQQARELAHQKLQTLYHLDATTLEELSAQSKQHPERRDWTFTFADKETYDIAGGQARIVMAIRGDEVADSYRFIHVPEEWERSQRSEETLMNLIKMICILAAFVCFLLGIFLQKQRRKPISFVATVALIFCLVVVDGYLLWPQTMASFNTTEPFTHQMWTTLGLSLIPYLAMSLGIAFMVNLVSGAATTHHFALRNHGAFVGVCLGIIFMGLRAILYSYTPLSLPIWANYNFLAYSLPMLYLIINTIVRYIMATSMTLFVSNALLQLQERYNLHRLVILFLCIVGSIIFVGAQFTLDSVSQWFIQSIVMGIIFFVMQELFLKYDATIIPCGIAIALAINLLQQKFLAGSSMPNIGITILILVIISHYTVRWLQKTS